MTLANTPPRGAGQVKHVTQTDKLLKAIREAGTDQYGNPVGIRTNELEKKTGIPTKTITALLSPQVTKGMVVVCKVTTASGKSVNEYRTGPGVPPPAFKPLDTRRAGIACFNAAVRQVSNAPLVAVSQPAATREPEVPVFLKSSTTPQAQVGSNSANRQEGTPLDTPPAVSAVTNPGTRPESTPKPATEAALNKEPAARQASAGAVLRMAIDQDGALQMGDEDDPARWVFTPSQVLALGDFLHGTQGVWRP